MTASCGGSGPRRASSTWRSVRWSTRCGICGPSARASRSGGCSPTCRTRRSSSLVDFRYLQDALTPRRSAGHPAGGPGRPRGPRGAATGRRLPGLHHHPRLARLRRREAHAAVQGGGGRRILHDQAEGGRRGRGRRPPPLASPGTPSVRTCRIAVDANQIWGYRGRDRRGWPDWRRSTRTGSRSRPRRTTSSGTPRIRRAVAPIRVATGEHVQNPVMFKQLLQAGAVDVVQIDACRVGGVNENVAILLLAAKFGVPVCPHAGGVGLCEMVQHLSMFDLRRRQRKPGAPDDRVRRPPARALRRHRCRSGRAGTPHRRLRVQAPGCCRSPSDSSASRTDRRGRVTTARTCQSHDGSKGDRLAQDRVDRMRRHCRGGAGRLRQWQHRRKRQLRRWSEPAADRVGLPPLRHRLLERLHPLHPAAGAGSRHHESEDDELRERRRQADFQRADPAQPGRRRAS